MPTVYFLIKKKEKATCIFIELKKKGETREVLFSSFFSSLFFLLSSFFSLPLSS